FLREYPQFAKLSTSGRAVSAQRRSVAGARLVTAMRTLHLLAQREYPFNERVIATCGFRCDVATDANWLLLGTEYRRHASRRCRCGVAAAFVSSARSSTGGLWRRRV